MQCSSLVNHQLLTIYKSDCTSKLLVNMGVTMEEWGPGGHMITLTNAAGFQVVQLHLI